METTKISKSEVISILESLHKFNRLDETTVDLMSIEYGIDCKQLCVDYGITYVIN